MTAVSVAIMLCRGIAVLVVACAIVACPIYLHLIHVELTQIRKQPASCRCNDGPGPVLPRVFPRLRNLGEVED